MHIRVTGNHERIFSWGVAISARSELQEKQFGHWYRTGLEEEI